MVSRRPFVLPSSSTTFGIAWLASLASISFLLWRFTSATYSQEHGLRSEQLWLRQWRSSYDSPGIASPPPVGVLRACAAPLSAGTVCNSHKVVPSSADDMPPLWNTPRALAQWGPLEEGYRGYGGECFYSDTYRFIYIRTSKSASTAVSNYLRKHACDVHSHGKSVDITNGENASSVNDETGARKICSGANYPPLDESDLLAPLPMSIGENVDSAMNFNCAAIPRWKWLQYFVFATTKHPLERAVSSYYFCSKFLSVSFAEFCVNPDSGNWCSFDKGSMVWQPGDAVNQPDLHWSAQSLHVCGIYGCLPDFFARTESLLDDFDRVISSINAHRVTASTPLPLFSTLDTKPVRPSVKTLGNSSVLLAAPENAHCRASILSWYAEDYERLGYASSDAADRATKGHL